MPAIKGWHYDDEIRHPEPSLPDPEGDAFMEWAERQLLSVPLDDHGWVQEINHTIKTDEEIR